jgi:hypothetical protein
VINVESMPCIEVENNVSRVKPNTDPIHKIIGVEYCEK